MKAREKKIIVILPGGGAKSYFQVGAWNKILNSGINFGGGQTKITVPNGVFGVSGGAIVGALIAMGKNKELFKLYNQIAGSPSEIYTSDFLKQVGNKIQLDTEAIFKYLLSGTNIFQKAGLLFRKSRKRSMNRILSKLEQIDSLANNEPLFRKLQDLVKISDVKSEIFRTGFVSLTDGKYYSPSHLDFGSDSDFQKAVLASASIPSIWSPVSNISTKDFEVSNLIDGGIRNITPFNDAVKYANQNDYAEYYFLVISPHTQKVQRMKNKPNLLNISTRSIYDIAMNEIQKTDLSEFLHVNDLVKQAKSKGVELCNKSGRKLKNFKVKIIRPSRELGFALDFSRSTVMDSFTHGFQQANEIIHSPIWE